MKPPFPTLGVNQPIGKPQILSYKCHSHYAAALGIVATVIEFWQRRSDPLCQVRNIKGHTSQVVGPVPARSCPYTDDFFSGHPQYCINALYQQALTLANPPSPNVSAAHASLGYIFSSRSSGGLRS